ncbi:MAG: hypothetical protein DWQ19_12170 [Crenarchaeota archaeon]|nr:MAG: hypothetical protein DWQ19_12170 [Thermoproteota archaeon]
MQKEIIKLTKEQENQFRKTFELKEDVKDDIYWTEAYEYAATYPLYIDEINAIGPVLVERKPNWMK